ncbi:MAG: YkgJ family cysteine cluster protein [Dehalococcoidales bacterium]|jgi:Fe-S-cluster containining protein|nr:YkgJ family cysteine cluster protein [Dehalococcoidales bacterium]NLE90194.1 YkgJ family cysteine cluster protein [Dehalococcoidales bacterium]
MELESDLGNESSNFSCFLCGECCSRYQVRVSLSEARCISEKLGIECEDFLERYTDSRWPGEKSFLLIHRNGACVFLKRVVGEHIAMCSIHSFKPDSCIQWTAGPYRKECRYGLERCWNLSIGENGQLIGSQNNIDRFESFVSSLDSEMPEPQE